ncbi:MAG: hypothetical protein LCH38_01630 [Proteobacteria bacterium]|nr:hypothetical protein [Pseudomonadota bacterium]
MRSFLDAKAMAKTLRQELSNRNIDLGHSECLEVVAKQFGHRDWNTMAADLKRFQRFDQHLENDAGLPKGWFKAGQGNDAYTASSVPSPGNPAIAAISIVSRENEKDGREPDPRDFCTVMQVIAAEAFRGKRIAFDAELRAENVRGSVTIWVRVDDIHGKSVAFDNREEYVENGSLKGTMDWTRRQIVLEVPERGETVHFGFYLHGRGQGWARGFAFSLTEDVPSGAGIARPKMPQNLDFRSN